MDLKEVTKNVLNDLLLLINQIKEDDYHFHISSLNATIGQHIRHILEFYTCFFDGIRSGIVNYDQRKRDKRIETSKDFTAGLIKSLQEKLTDMDTGRNVFLEVKYGDKESGEKIKMETNILRELTYNIEHTIHHLAIIKPFILLHFDYVQLPKNFGIASSTLRHLNQK